MQRDDTPNCVCLTCGKRFYARPFDIRRGSGKYCGRPCYFRAPKAPQVKAGTWRVCKTCGASFYVYPSELTQARRTAEYCSIACTAPRRREASSGRRLSEDAKQKIREQATGRRIPSRDKPPVERTCAHCGERYRVPGSLYARAPRRRFCTLACSYAHMRLHPEERPNYRGGRVLEYGPGWAGRARQARERDAYTCQDCGVVQRRPALDVHHLVSRRTFNRDHVAANALDNLVSLCKSCHTIRENTLTVAPLHRASS